MSIRFWLILVLSVIASILFSVRFLLPEKTRQLPNGINFSQAQVRIKDQLIHVALSQTPEEITQGLSGTESMEENQGMLFVMPRGETPSFWMKNMRYSLDFVWIYDDRIIDISKDIPPPESPDSPLQTYSPSMPITHVLELNGGWIERHGIEIGDRVDLSGL